MATPEAPDNDNIPTWMNYIPEALTRLADAGDTTTPTILQNADLTTDESTVAAYTLLQKLYGTALMTGMAETPEEAKGYLAYILESRFTTEELMALRLVAQTAQRIEADAEYMPQLSLEGLISENRRFRIVNAVEHYVADAPNQEDWVDRKQEVIDTIDTIGKLVSGDDLDDLAPSVVLVLSYHIQRLHAYSAAQWEELLVITGKVDDEEQTHEYADASPNAILITYEITQLTRYQESLVMHQHNSARREKKVKKLNQFLLGRGRGESPYTTNALRALSKLGTKQVARIITTIDGRISGDSFDSLRVSAAAVDIASIAQMYPEFDEKAWMDLYAVAAAIDQFDQDSIQRKLTERTQIQPVGLATIESPTADVLWRIKKYKETETNKKE